MRLILLLLCSLIASCGGSSDLPKTYQGTNVVQTFNFDYVYVQNGIGTHFCTINDLPKLVDEASLWSENVCVDIEVYDFKVSKQFTADQIKTFINFTERYTDCYTIYSLDHITEDNYIPDIYNVFVFDLSKNLDKLNSFPSIDTVIVQCLRFYDTNGNLVLDNSASLKTLLSTYSLHVYVGLDLYANWYQMILTSPKNYINHQLRVLQLIHDQFGNRIDGVYVPEEPPVEGVETPIKDYYETIIEAAHSYGYQVIIAPYSKCQSQ